MTLIGELAVNAVVRTEEVERGARAFRAEVGKMGEIAKAAGGSVAALGLTAIAVGYNLVESQGAIADAIDTTSQKLDLAVDQISRLRYAGSVAANMADGELDGALVRMNTNIGLAAHGAGKAGTSISELGLDAQRLARLDTDKRLYEIADALEKVSRSSDRVRLAEKIFGTGDMALVLQKGRAGLADLAAESDRVGATLDNLANKKLGDADDALHRMEKSVAGTKHALGGLLAPAVTAIADDVTETISLIRNGVPAAMTQEQQAIKFANESLQRNADVRKRVIEQVEAQRHALGLLRGQQMLANAQEEYQKLQSDRQSLSSQVENTRRGNETFGMSDLQAAQFNRKNHMVDRGLNDQLIAELEIRQKLEETRKKEIDAKERDAQLSERAKSLIEENLTPLERLQQRLAEIQQLQAAGKLSADQAMRASESARKGFSADVGSGGDTQRAPLSALKFGSSEAFRAIQESRNQDRNKVPEKQLKELEEGNKLATQMLDTLKTFKVLETGDWS